ncbi:MAG: flagellar hook-basal body complex protein FliE [Deltaproteobacteria bacterium]|nr:flagellar hook-basal body complex protein FliE [Deltaproteobacteria bacterium]
MVPKIDFEKALFIANQHPEKTVNTFKDIFKKYLRDVDRQQKAAESAINQFLAGKMDVHQVMIALEKADLSFRLLMKIRNKLLEAYQEIMRMQV